MLIDLSLSDNYISAWCKTMVDVEMTRQSYFEKLKLEDRLTVHAQGYMQFVLIVVDIKLESLPGYP